MELDSGYFGTRTVAGIANDEDFNFDGDANKRHLNDIYGMAVRSSSGENYLVFTSNYISRSSEDHPSEKLWQEAVIRQHQHFIFGACNALHTSSCVKLLCVVIA